MPGARGFGDLLLELLGKEVTQARPMVAKAYRGAWHPELWPPAAEPSPMGADEAGHFWSSSDPAVAQDYTALDLARDGLPNVQPHITPAEMRFQRPLIVDAQGRPWSEISGASGGTYSTDGLAQLGKDAGYDGLVVNNVRDMKAVNGSKAPVATTYTALQPGTVFSRTTGERLYTGAGAIGAGAAAAALTQPTEAKADTMEPQGFGDQVVRMMLNQPQLGPQDGQPQQPQQRQTLDDHLDAIRQFWARNPPQVAPGVQFSGPPPQSVAAQAPPSAMLRNRLAGGYPLDERGEPVVASRDVTPGQPQPSVSPMMQYIKGIRNDLAGASPLELGGAALDFLGISDVHGDAMSAITNALGRGSRSLIRRELRDYTESGTRKTLAEDARISRWQADEAAQPMRDAKDYAQLPPHVVQQRDATTGRFGAIPDDVKAAREAGRQRLDLERRANEKYPTMYDAN
jgi:hypothetical protein